jgi:hypothetical protein
VTDVVTCGAKHEENFETPGEAESWENGDVNVDAVFTSFLGRLGKENPRVAKTFTMPSSGTKGFIKFDLYDIDGILNNDKLFVSIQGIEREIDLITVYFSSRCHDGVCVDTAKKELPSGASEGDHVYEVFLQVDSSKWTGDAYGNQLSVAIRVETEQSVKDDSYGVDNFAIEVQGCDDRMLENGAHPSTQRTPKGEDETYYCRAQDYPCGERADMVNICHYSNHRGYQTFCIPVPDSDILRFYGRDYCGPCTGGMGTIARAK